MKILFFKKYLGRKLFNKIFIIYSSIIILSLLVLSVSISANIAQTLEQKELNSNMQLVSSISSYIDHKYYLSMNLMQQIYANNDISYDLTSFLKNDFEKYISKRLDIYSVSASDTLASYRNYLNTFASRESDISDIVLYSTTKDFYFVLGDKTEQNLFEKGTNVKDLMDSLSNSRHYSCFLTNIPFSKDFITFSTISSISDPINLSRIGYLIINYKLDGIYSLIKKHPDEMKGYILVLTNDGDVLFDSSNNYYGSKYPDFNSLSAATPGQRFNKNYYINVIKSPDSGTIIAGIIPRMQIHASTTATKRTIFFITLLLIVVSLVVTFIIINVFSKRTKVIMHGMEELQKGNFSVQIPIEKSEDELTQIAANFNNMCSAINEYIKREYISELKQKNAELMALQSQINPHFLFNTLEAVRMKAVSAGASNVASMVYILATLFRNSISGGTYIPISAELEYCKLYLQLFKLRYEETLTFDIDINAEIMSYSIVKFTLQPIIENCLFHGIKQDSKDNTISIKGLSYGSDILFVICDNGIGIDKEKLDYLKKTLEDNTHKQTNTIGLTNVNERLKIIYGCSYGISISSEIDKGTCVEIRMPAKKLEELDDYVQGTTGR